MSRPVYSFLILLLLEKIHVVSCVYVAVPVDVDVDAEAGALKWVACHPRRAFCRFFPRVPWRCRRLGRAYETSQTNVRALQHCAIPAVLACKSSGLPILALAALLVDC